MAVEHLAYGWAIGSVTLLLVILYFTRLARPIRSRWQTGTCEFCGCESYLTDNDKFDACGSCEKDLLPHKMGRVTAALTGLPFTRRRRR